MVTLNRCGWLKSRVLRRPRSEPSGWLGVIATNHHSHCLGSSGSCIDV